MKINIGKFVAKHRYTVLIVGTVLLILSYFGYRATGINYDLLKYLPQDLESTQGATILDEDFSNAATSMFVIENKTDKEIKEIKKQIEQVDGVSQVIWRDDLADITIPGMMLPDAVKEAFFQNNSTLLMIKFQESTSSERTLQAVEEIRTLTNGKGHLSGATPIVKDTKDLIDREAPRYVILAVILSTIVLIATNSSTLVPLIFLISIGYAVAFNMGTNFFFGEISYITQAIAAVLQLAVTMDYSIFLFNTYTEERKKFPDDHITAMGNAIDKTAFALMGSSLTTLAGFLALIAMELSLGKDIGLVMAKGVLFGLLSAVTILPSFVMVFDRWIYRYQHKLLLPSFNKTSRVVLKKRKGLALLFFLLFLPSIYGNAHVPVYYNLDRSLPRDLPSIMANKKLKEEFNMQSTHFLLVDERLSDKDFREISDRVKAVKGIEKVTSLESFTGPMIPKNFMPDKVKDNFLKNGHEMMMIQSSYPPASPEVSQQIEQLSAIAKEKDPSAKLTGESVLTKDLTRIADSDFQMVNVLSIIVVFLIILLIYKSLAMPFVLILAIELAIMWNMATSFYLNRTLPFVASIIIGTVQLGATIDYSILMSSRFFTELLSGKEKFEAMEATVKATGGSIMTSALSFFAATVGVGIYSDMDIVSSICTLMARGALISMLVILFLLPALLLLFYKPLVYTTKSLKPLRTQTTAREKLA